MNSNSKKSESSFLFKGQKKEFLDWLESLRISKYWLDTMSYTDSYALCKEIHQVLKSFKELDLIEKEKLFSLIEVHSCLQGIYEKLHLHHLNNKLPLNKEQQKNVNVLIHAYMELVNAYYEIMLNNKSKKHKLSEQHLALNACKALQGLSVVFLTTAEMYTNPPKIFWLLCYRIFSLSEEFNLLDSKVKIDNAIYSAALLFKQLIIFYIIDKNNLYPDEIDKIFKLLLRGINYIQSYISSMTDVSANAGSEIFGFSLNKDEPPFIQNNIPLATAKLLRYVEKQEVIKIVQFLLYEEKEHQQSNSVKPDLFTRVLLTLEHKKHKTHRRITKNYTCNAMIGIDNLVEFLLEKEGKKALTSNKNQTNELEDELDSLHIALDWDSEKEIDENGFIIENLRIIDSSINGYGIIWNNNKAEKLQVGEVIGIIPEFNSNINKMEVGLIRRIKITGDSIIFGIEIIGLESTLIYIERDNNPDSGEWALFLFGSPDYDVGILCHKERHYQSGDAILIQLAEKKAPCRLGPVLNSTPLLDHIALSY